jgi:hypothetical protein
MDGTGLPLSTLTLGERWAVRGHQAAPAIWRRSDTRCSNHEARLCGDLIASLFYRRDVTRLRRRPIRPKPAPMSARLPGSGTDAGELAGRKTVNPEFGSSR